VEFIDTTTFLSEDQRPVKVRAALDGGKMEQIHPIFCHVYPFLIWETT
jgi:hypothetical protein